MGEEMKHLLLTSILFILMISSQASAKEPYQDFCIKLLPIAANWDYQYEDIQKAMEYLEKKEARQKASISEKICLSTLLYMKYSFDDEPTLSELDESNRILSNVFSLEPGNHFAHAQLSFNSLAVMDYDQAEELYDTAKKGLVHKDIITTLELKIKTNSGECDWVRKHGGRLSVKGNKYLMGIAHGALADCYIQEGNIKGAERYLRNKKMRLPAYDTLVQYSEINAQLGRWDLAIEAAEQALVRRQWRRGMEALSWALVGKGTEIIKSTNNYKIALSYLEYGYKYDPYNVSALIKIAEAYLDLTEKSIGVESAFKPYKEKAVFYTEKALELDPSNPTANSIFRELARLRM